MLLEGLNKICNAFKKNQHIVSLDLSLYTVNSSQILSKIIQQQDRRRWNRIQRKNSCWCFERNNKNELYQPEFAQKHIFSFRTIESLIKKQIEDNFIPDEQMDMILDALKENKNLTFLGLRENAMTTANCLPELLKNSPFLTHLDLGFWIISSISSYSSKKTYFSCRKKWIIWQTCANFWISQELWTIRDTRFGFETEKFLFSKKNAKIILISSKKRSKSHTKRRNEGAERMFHQFNILNKT